MPSPSLPSPTPLEETVQAFLDLLRSPTEPSLHQEGKNYHHSELFKRRKSTLASLSSQTLPSATYDGDNGYHLLSD